MIHFSSAERKDFGLESYAGTGRGNFNDATDNYGFTMGGNLNARLTHNRNYADPNTIKLAPQSSGSQSLLSEKETQQLIQHLCDTTYLHQHQIVAYIKKTFVIDYSTPGLNIVQAVRSA